MWLPQRDEPTIRYRRIKLLGDSTCLIGFLSDTVGWRAGVVVFPNGCLCPAQPPASFFYLGSDLPHILWSFTLPAPAAFADMGRRVAPFCLWAHLTLANFCVANHALLNARDQQYEPFLLPGGLSGPLSRFDNS